MLWVRGKPLPLWGKILFGMGLGVGAAALVNLQWLALSDDVKGTIGQWVALPGLVFLRLIQLIVIPLVLSSIILSVAQSDGWGKIQGVFVRTLLYFTVSSSFAIVIGWALGQLLHFGNLATEIPAEVGLRKAPQEIPPTPVQLANLVPNNLFESFVEQRMLQIVVGAIIVAFALLQMAPKKRALMLDLLERVQELCLRVVQLAMVMAPWAVFGLLFQSVLSLGFQRIASMGVYIAVVLLGLLALFTAYCVAVAVFTPHPLRTFLRHVAVVQLLAFSTSSSAATMPYTLEVAKGSLGVSQRVRELVIPLGTTVNMDGTALYQVIVSLYLFHMYQIPVSTGAMLFVVCDYSRRVHRNAKCAWCRTCDPLFYTIPHGSSPGGHCPRPLR